jgi:hypothetical protein
VCAVNFDSHTFSRNGEELPLIAKEFGLLELFGEKASVMASFKKQAFQSLEVTPEALLGLIQRHPATAEQLAGDFNVPFDSIFQTLENMVSEGMLMKEQRNSEFYYFIRA